MVERPSKQQLIERLRQRLVIIPKPGSEPFKPTYPTFHTGNVGGQAKAGDSAGFMDYDANWGACAAGAGNWMRREMIWAVDPLCEEVAQFLERLPELNASLVACLRKAAADSFDVSPAEINPDRLREAADALERCGNFPHE